LYPTLLHYLGVGGIVVLQVLALAAAAGLMADLMRRVTGNLWLGAMVGLVIALDVRLNLFGYMIMTEALAIGLMALWLWCSWRALAERRRDCAIGGAATLLALALTRAPFVLFGVLFAIALTVAVYRKAPGVRVYAAAMGLVALLLAGKAAVAHHYIGTTSGNTGVNLVRFLSLDPRLVVALPVNDPLRRYWREHHSLEWLIRADGLTWASMDGWMTRSYLRAAAISPGLFAATVWNNYVMQGTANGLMVYRGDPNVRLVKETGNPLLATERFWNRLVYESGLSFLLTTLCLLAAVPLLIVTRDTGTRWMLALPFALTIYIAGASAAAFAGLEPGRDFRAGVMYELPAILLWVIVPVSLLTLFVRSNDARHHA